MNKIIGIVLLIFVGIWLALALVPDTPPFDYAKIYSPDGGLVKEGEVKKYKADSAGICIQFADGTTYGTGINNVVLIQNKDNADYINEEGYHYQ